MSRDSIHGLSTALYPELERFPAREQAEAAAQAWSTQRIKSPAFWIMICLYTATVGLLTAGVLVLMRRWFRLSSALFGGIVGAVTGATSTIFFGLIYRRRCRRFLREQLTALGIPICVPCGYDLRGLTSGRCPECGASCEIAQTPGAATATATDEEDH